jgi:hypothetical protein
LLAQGLEECVLVCGQSQHCDGAAYEWREVPWSVDGGTGSILLTPREVANNGEQDKGG